MRCFFNGFFPRLIGSVLFPYAAVRRVEFCVSAFDQKNLRGSKINNPQMIYLVDDEVFGFQVSMNYSIFMEALKNLYDFGGYEFRFVKR